MTGVLLRGKYRLQERLGQGGMAVVYAGQHAGTERAVAIKRLLPERVSDPKLVARFELEARAAGRIRSRHVLGILDIDRDEQGIPFLVMERLYGESLSAKVKREKRLPVEEALGIVRQVLLGLVEAHGAGVIHRDLKPANIFIEQSSDGNTIVKLVDFGISKVRGVDEHNELTEEGETLGTMAYMPPEQLGGGGNISPAADLWSVGVILFRLLTGEMPFAGVDTMSLILAILQDPTPKLAEHGVDGTTSRVLQPILDRTLSKTPAQRYWGADELLRALEAAGRELGFTVHSEPLSPTLVARAAWRPAPTGRRTRIATAGVFAVGVAAGWFVLGSRALPRPASAVRIETTPVDAVLTVDEHPVPDRRQIPLHPGRSHTVRVTANGYQPATFTLPDRADAQALVVLARAAAPVPEAPAVPAAEAPPATAGAATTGSTARTAPVAPPAPRPVVAQPRPPAPKPATAPAARPPTILTSPD